MDKDVSSPWGSSKECGSKKPRPTPGPRAAESPRGSSTKILTVTPSPTGRQVRERHIGRFKTPKRLTGAATAAGTSLSLTGTKKKATTQYRKESTQKKPRACGVNGGGVTNPYEKKGIEKKQSVCGVNGGSPPGLSTPKGEAIMCVKALKARCPLCKGEECDGECRHGTTCYVCGARHVVSRCPFGRNTKRGQCLTQFLKSNNVCVLCCMPVGNPLSHGVRNKTLQCPVQKRVRALIRQRAPQQGLAYDDYVKKIYASDDAFNEFLMSWMVKK